MEAKVETAGSDYVHDTGASEAGPAHTPRKYSNDIGNGNRNNNRGGGSRNHLGNKGSKSNNNVVDILDLAVPQSKVRPIDRLLDRYDWSSASMTPLLQDTDRSRRAQHCDHHPLSQPSRPAPSPPPRPPAPSRTPPPPPPPPPTRPPLGSWASEHKRHVRKSLWKRARELVSSFFVRAAAAAAAAAGPKVNCCWSH